MAKSSHHRSRVARVALAWAIAWGTAAAGQAGSDVETIDTGAGNLLAVLRESVGLTSSYVLDREFWLGLQARHPEGLVAAVPRRGGLVYAPARDARAVESLRFGVAVLYAGGPGARLSSALYLFKDGRWSVFQAPQPRAD